MGALAFKKRGHEATTLSSGSFRFTKCDPLGARVDDRIREREMTETAGPEICCISSPSVSASGRRLHLFRASSLPSRFLLTHRCRRKRSHGLGFRLPFPYSASETRPSANRKRASFGSGWGASCRSRLLFSCRKSPSFIAARDIIVSWMAHSFISGMATCRTLKIWAWHLWWLFYDKLRHLAHEKLRDECATSSASGNADLKHTDTT